MSSHESDGNPLFDKHEPYLIDDSGSDARDLADFNKKYAPSVHTQSKTAKRSQKRQFQQQQLDALRARVAHAEMEKERRYQLLLLRHEEELEREKQQKWPVPGNMALVPCGMVTIMLNYPNTGHFEMVSSVPSFQILFAGICQQIAGIFEWMNGVTFAYTAFSTYACFHISIGLMIIMPADPAQADVQVNYYDPLYLANPAKFAPTADYFLGVYMLVYTIHGFALFVCSFKMSLVLSMLLLNVTLTYFLQCIADMRGITPLLHAGGYSGIVSGGFMMYLGTSETINAIWGRTILPTFPYVDLRRFFCGKRDSDDEGSETSSSQV